MGNASSSAAVAPEPRLPSGGCPASEQAKATAMSLPAGCPANSDAKSLPSECPVQHGGAAKQMLACTSDDLNPKNLMFQENQKPHADQKVSLPTDRVTSSIPQVWLPMIPLVNVELMMPYEWKDTSRSSKKG